MLPDRADVSVLPWVLPTERGPAKAGIGSDGARQPWLPWRAVTDALGWVAGHHDQGGVLAAAADRGAPCRLMLAAITPAPDRWAEISQAVADQMLRAGDAVRKIAHAALVDRPQVRAKESLLLLAPIRRL